MNPFSSFETPIVTAMAAVVFVAALPVFGGCDDRVESPEDVVRSFLGDLRGGDQQRALESVWPQTRKQLLAGYEDLEAYFEDEPPVERHDLLVVTRVESPMVISRIRAVDEIPERPSDGQLVTLRLELRGDRATHIDLRWGSDDRRWYVELPLEERSSLGVLPDDEAETRGEQTNRGEDR